MADNDDAVYSPPLSSDIEAHLLFELTLDGLWDEAMLHLSDPKLPIQTKLDQLFVTSGDYDSTLLGNCSSPPFDNACPTALMEQIIGTSRQDPQQRDILLMADNHGFIPLHDLAANSSDEAAFRLFIRESPASLKAQNVNGSTALRIVGDYPVDRDGIEEIAEMLDAACTSYHLRKFSTLQRIVGLSKVLGGLIDAIVLPRLTVLMCFNRDKMGLDALAVPSKKKQRTVGLKLNPKLAVANWLLCKDVWSHILLFL